MFLRFLDPHYRGFRLRCLALGYKFRSADHFDTFQNRDDFITVIKYHLLLHTESVLGIETETQFVGHFDSRMRNMTRLLIMLLVSTRFVSRCLLAFD